MVFQECEMLNIIGDFTLFEISIEIIFVLSLLCVLMIIRAVPTGNWIKFHQSDWFDAFLHNKH